MAGPSREFWQQRFELGQTPWDRGAEGPQLAAWAADGTLPVPAADASDDARPNVLVPGCGSGHDVLALARMGLRVTGLDYAAAAIERTSARLGELTEAQRARVTLVTADALSWLPDAPFAFVYEQTCLCALHPDHWVRYGEQLHRWLAPGGRLLAMLMQAPRPQAAQGEIIGPPYHCDVHAVRAILPDGRWAWPKPPYPRVAHPGGMGAELAVVLTPRLAEAVRPR